MQILGPHYKSNYWNDLNIETTSIKHFQLVSLEVEPVVTMDMIDCSLQSL